MPDFTLHPQLVADTVEVGDLALCRVLLSNDANYPWLILVPRRPDIVELIDLTAVDRAALSAEIDAAARALKATVPCEKLNVAALGNMVPQLHVHIIARRHGDPAWPKPVWGAVPAIAYNPAVRDGFVTALQRALDVAAIKEL
ncbi:histidine triad (HIT) protein [Pseudolabrys sp. Root1462]|uniref:HIT domain-containing protein n=1 Tax=Pseudolabrys sp. Root1462 TaxID=1736466 RepID=UPI0007029F42|nr:HIT domain-containing protein [Pseudolabrys sp. Root1462]KQY97221.1 histidine triad (HIT) protein [Pseudolabrys sp. Root1462]